MINKLSYLASRVLDTPLMITKIKLDQILDVIGGRIGLDTNAQVQEPRVPAGPPTAPITQQGIATIPIHGTLVHRSHGLSAMSGLTSYTSIRSQFREALADPEVSSILLDIDSPGGEVAGVFDLADEIYAARGTKPITAMINERGYSAAYALASAADSIYLSRTAGVGSIGVVMLHVDRSEADKKAGVTYTPIYAGSKKLDGSPHAPLSKTAQATAQATVDSIYSLFVSTVARNNGLSETQIRDTEAGTYHGQAAIDNGLADAVLSYQEVINQLTYPKGARMPKRTAQTPTPEPKLEPVELKEPKLEEPVVPEPKPKPVAATPTPAPVATPTPDPALAVTAERDRCIAILESCSLAKTPDIAMGLISDGSSVETAHKMVMTVLAERSAATPVISAVNPATSGTPNPLLVDAKKRADAAK